jgi:hypothetical protein
VTGVGDSRDFVLVLGPDGTGYRAKVLRSPAGQGSERFVPPYPPRWTGWYRLDEAMRDTCHPGSGSSAGKPAPGAVALAREVGIALHEALFWGRVKELFDQSIGNAAGVLRIQLRFDPSDPRSMDLAGLPWELLRHPGRPAFMCLNPETPIVRWPEAQGSWPHHPFEPPLRVLVVAPHPHRTMPLDFETELHGLQQSASTRGGVEVTLLSNATLDAFVNVLQKAPFHVLHFMGHGFLAAGTERSGLLFETSRGDAESVCGETLASHLQGCSRMLLAVLNACHSGDHPQAVPHDPFAGVAITLVQAGLPAAVAMRGSISDRGAVAFTKSLYDSLVQGHPIDVAVTQGRRAISPNPETSAEWSVPMLFLRAEESRLFLLAEGTSPALPLASLPEHSRSGINIKVKKNKGDFIFY